MNYKEISDILFKVLSNSIVKSVLVIIISVVLYKLISMILNARGKRLKRLDKKKRETYIHLINSMIKYAVLILAFFMLLSVNKINITSMLAGLGIAGIILGVAVQDALKDIIRGFDIVSDDYFKVGDLVEYEGVEGIVLEIGIKTVKIKNIKNENITSIPNRNINSVSLVSKAIYIDVPLPYETTSANAKDIMLEICKTIEKAPEVKTCSYLGVNLLDDSAVKHLIKLDCKSNLKKLQIRRNALSAVIEVLENRGIAIPYNQLDIHTK